MEPEQDLNQNETLWWKKVIESITDIVMVVDINGTITFINHTIPGFTIDKVVGTAVFNYIPVAYHEPYRETIKKIFQTGEAVEFDVTGSGPNGSAAWYATRLCAIKGSDNVVKAVVAISSDITKRKRAEDELSQAQRLVADQEAKMAKMKESLPPSQN